MIARWKNLDRDTKFGNTPTRCRAANYMHQSKLEAKRCDELHILERAGDVTELEAHPQPRFRFDFNGVHVADYLADFKYRDRDGALIVEDTKGVRTEVYKLKARLLKALYGIEVREVRR